MRTDTQSSSWKKSWVSKIAIALGGLVIGPLVAVAAKPTLEHKVIPAVMEKLGLGETMILYPSDPNEKPQSYTMYRFPLAGDMVGIFVSDVSDKKGNRQVFYVRGSTANSLMHFVFVPARADENAGGSFSGSDEDSPNHYVGSMQGVDKWTGEAHCHLHSFTVVLGPRGTALDFPQLVKAYQLKVGKLEDPHWPGTKEAMILAPCTTQKTS